MERAIALALVLTLFATVAIAPAGAAGPHKCEWTGERYHCVGIGDDLCFYQWSDDDSDGDPLDENAQIQKRACATSIPPP